MKKITGKNGKPTIINIGKNDSNTSAIKDYIKCWLSKLVIRQNKYLNNIVEQDHRFIKWRISNGLGFKEFKSLILLSLSGIKT